jgi:hypothetical protein
MSRRHHGNRPPRLGPPRGADPARSRVDAPPAGPPVAPSRPIDRAEHAPTPAPAPSAPPAGAAEDGPVDPPVITSAPPPVATAPAGGTTAGCTAPQLRRFIKSRPYVPMHELRRRFGINGHEDDVCAVDLADRRVYVGLPPREGSLLGELLRGGDIGYELSLDPRTPVVVGLYPMRPVARG